MATNTHQTRKPKTRATRQVNPRPTKRYKPKSTPPEYYENRCRVRNQAQKLLPLRNKQGEKPPRKVIELATTHKQSYMPTAHNLIYNTEKSPILMTSYGRHIQELIKHCLKIENRQERKACAEAIIGIMEKQAPALKQQPNYKQILWEHLAKMAEYRLDIDYPVAIHQHPITNTPQSRPAYTRNNIQYRHYGHLLEELIKITTRLKHPKKRQEYINLTANQMKKSYLTWVRPDVENDRILEDLHTLSRGRIKPRPQEVALRKTKKLLAEMQSCPASDASKKKKKS